MAFYYTIRLVLAGEGRERVLTTTKDQRAATVEEYGYLNDAVKWLFNRPGMIRIEVDERDTQLYAYPEKERVYQKHVILKNGQLWKFYGKGSEKAVLVEDFNMREYPHAYHI